MGTDETKPLRVLIANEREDKLAEIVPLVVSLGHEAIVRELDVAQVADITQNEQPDVALVGIGESSARAVQVIDRFVKEAVCPVIIVLHEPDPEFVKQATKHGVFACIADSPAEDLQSTLEIVLHRFAAYHGLEGAFGRRALVERATGILMERHSTDEIDAYEMLRGQARTTNRRIIDVATAVLAAHPLLPKPPEPS